MVETQREHNVNISEIFKNYETFAQICDLISQQILATIRFDRVEFELLDDTKPAIEVLPGKRLDTHSIPLLNTLSTYTNVSFFANCRLFAWVRCGQGAFRTEAALAGVLDDENQPRLLYRLEIRPTIEIRLKTSIKLPEETITALQTCGWKNGIALLFLLP